MWLYGAGHLVAPWPLYQLELSPKRANHEVYNLRLLGPREVLQHLHQIKLMKELRLTGRNQTYCCVLWDRKGLLVHMFSPKLEISGLNENNFVDLPQVFSQKEIQWKKKHSAQKDVKKWKYLDEVHLPQIDAGIGLLIGTNVPKILEPWKVINSREDGPFAVKTILGWIVNGHLDQRRTSKTNRDTGWPQVMANRISVVSLDNLISTANELWFSWV